MDCKCRERLRSKLSDIAPKLSTENLEKLKFLFDIPPGEAEKISNPEGLFQILEYELKITPHSLDSLVNCLDKAGRKDLAAELEIFMRYNQYSCEGEKTDTVDKKGTSASGSTESTATLDIIKTAEGHNNRGRVEFQDKKYEKACQQYTLALECLPEGPENDEMIAKYLCNRAACYVNMRKFNEAHSDCDKVLGLDPQNKKARYRLAQALRGLGQISDAYIEVTSLREKHSQDSLIAELASSLQREIEDARRKALNKRIEFPKYFQKSDFDAAINCLCEVLILMPRIPALNAELMNIYWQRAECYRRKHNFEDALKDCEEADRLCPGDQRVLATKMFVLEELRKYKQCYEVCNQLISKGFKVDDAKRIIKRLMPKIERESKESKKEDDPELSQAPGFAEGKGNKSKKKKRTKRKGKRKQGGANTANIVMKSNTDESNAMCSRNDESLQRLQDDEDSSDLGEEAIDETCVDTNVIHMEDIAAEILVFKSNKQGNIEAANVEHCYTTTPNKEDYRNTDVPGKRKEDVFPLKPGVRALQSATPTIPGSPMGATAASVSNTNDSKSPFSNNDGSSTTPGDDRAIRKSEEETVDVTVNDLEVTSKKHAVSNIFAVDRSEQISNDLNRLSIADEGDDGNIGKMHFCGSGKLNEREEREPFRKPETTMSPREKAALPEFSAV